MIVKKVNCRERKIVNMLIRIYTIVCMLNVDSAQSKTNSNGNGDVVFFLGKCNGSHGETEK